MAYQIEIVGHKGAPLEAPENTIASFEKAIRLGVEAVEMDVQMTSDDQLVVIHHAEVARTDRGNVYVFERKYHYLKKLLPQLPLLEEVIELCKGKVGMELEIKRQHRATLLMCLDLIKEQDVDSDVQLTSYHPMIVADSREISPRVATGLIFKAFPQWMDKRLREQTVLDQINSVNADVVHLPLVSLDESLVEFIHNHGIRVHSGMTETEEDFLKAKEIGVNEFTTDNPRLALNVLRGRK